jgi:hypothetical protein
MIAQERLERLKPSYRQLRGGLGCPETTRLAYAIWTFATFIRPTSNAAAVLGTELARKTAWPSGTSDPERRARPWHGDCSQSGMPLRLTSYCPKAS